MISGQSISGFRWERREQVRALAQAQAGVLSRTQLYAAGCSRAEVRANVRARRWRALGRHTIAIEYGPLVREAIYWSAVLEGGPRAFIDGECALVLAGLEHYRAEHIRVSVPRGAKIRHRGTHLDIRQTRRWSPDDIVGSGVPRAKPPVAAVRAALWAKSNRQAALILTMTVQQGLASVTEISLEMLRVRRDKRRAFIHGLLLDLLGGVRSLGERDVLLGCRERGLPEPEMQVLRRTASGNYYLDFRWRRYRLVVEVDGIQHAWAQHVVGDALRHNTIALEGDTVLRLPLLGLRVSPDDFFDQIRRALIAAGWRGEEAA